MRTQIKDISAMSRNTQGVTLIRLSEGELLTEIEAVQSLSDETVTDLASVAAADTNDNPAADDSALSD